MTMLRKIQTYERGVQKSVYDFQSMKEVGEAERILIGYRGTDVNVL